MPERAIGSVAEHETLIELIESGRPAAQVEAFARAHRMRTVRYLLSRISDEHTDDELTDVRDGVGHDVLA